MIFYEGLYWFGLYSPVLQSFLRDGTVKGLQSQTIRSRFFTLHCWLIVAWSVETVECRTLPLAMLFFVSACSSIFLPLIGIETGKKCNWTDLRRLGDCCTSMDFPLRVVAALMLSFASQRSDSSMDVTDLEDRLHSWLWRQLFLQPWYQELSSLFPIVQ